MNNIKWIIAITCLTVSCAIYYVYADSMPLYISYLTMISGVLLATGSLYTTSQGYKVRELFHSTRNEARKIVWPARQEVMQSSLIVVIMVLIMSFILWGFDTILFKLMAWLTGQGV